MPVAEYTALQRNAMLFRSVLLSAKSAEQCNGGAGKGGDQVNSCCCHVQFLLFEFGCFMYSFVTGFGSKFLLSYAQRSVGLLLCYVHIIEERV